MFLDLRDQWPHEPWTPPPAPQPRLNPKQERVVLWLIGLNVIGLLCAPICGATLFDAVMVLLRR